MIVPVTTTLYAGVLGLLAMGLSVQVGRARAATGISFGDEGNPQLLVAMRRQANFVEYVPLVLILMALLELSGVSATAIHGLGGALVAFRVCHAIGFQPDSSSPLRGIGAAGTALVLVVSSIWAIVTFF